MEKDLKRINQFHQEHAAMCATGSTDYYNTEDFRKHLENSPVWKWTDKLAQYEQKLLERALKELKTKKEWQDAEANDIRPNTYGARRHMSAFELLDLYKDKIQRSYKAEKWFLDRIEECNCVIANLEAWQTSSKSKARRIKHWRERRVVFDLGYYRQVDKSHRYERLINKWRSICSIIRQADINKEISEEKLGNGNKYGFNPNMKDRSCATGIFNDGD